MLRKILVSSLILVCMIFTTEAIQKAINNKVSENVTSLQISQLVSFVAYVVILGVVWKREIIDVLSK